MFALFFFDILGNDSSLSKEAIVLGITRCVVVRWVDYLVVIYSRECLGDPKVKRGLYSFLCVYSYIGIIYPESFIFLIILYCEIKSTLEFSSRRFL